MASFIEKKQEKETDIMASICDYLCARRYFFYRVNNVGVFDPVKGIHRRLPKYARKGVADIFLLHRGKPIFIEVKTSKGVQSESQKEFEKDVKANGGKYFIARCIEDVMEQGL